MKALTSGAKKKVLESKKSTMSDLLTFLRSHTAEALVDPSVVYSCAEADPLDKAFQLLKEHKILSVPVKNNDGKYTSFCDILDLVECVAAVRIHV
jgi:CBS domain-containing protein